jgi:hypothetical protein
MTSIAKAFFREAEDYFYGNDPARGPWHADACPVTGVIARAFEAILFDEQGPIASAMQTLLLQQK